MDLKSRLFLFVLLCSCLSRCYLGKQRVKVGGMQHARLQRAAVPGRGTLRLDGSQACATVSTSGWRSTCCAASQTRLACACEACQCMVVPDEVSASAAEAMAAQEVHPTMAVARGFGEAVMQKMGKEGGRR